MGAVLDFVKNLDPYVAGVAILAIVSLEVVPTPGP